MRGDRVQLQQVVLNLVLNGLEAMREPHAGARTLVIRTARDGRRRRPGHGAGLGPGIAEKDLGHIFEPLYTTKPEGLGMGLAIVRTIVRAHGGRWGPRTTRRAGRASVSRCRRTRRGRDDGSVVVDDLTSPDRRLEIHLLA